MKLEIKLTNESSNTVFVDGVNVKNGVYYTASNPNTLTLFVIKRNNILYLVDAFNDTKKDNATSLSELIIKSSWRYGNFYTIPDNKRIVTEREVTIDDLKNTDHVGFVTDKGKCYIVNIGNGEFKPICTNVGMESCNTLYNSNTPYKSISECLKNVSTVQNIYRFMERTGEGSLYEWLNKK